jgi:MarR family transcriptional regulator, organic hydroperoxide resistance regulator
VGGRHESASQIGARLALDSSTLLPLLRRLGAMGSGDRAPDRDDARLVSVSPTAGGRPLRRKSPAVNERICHAAGLPLASQLKLAHELHALADGLRSIREATTGFATMSRTIESRGLQ